MKIPCKILTLLFLFCSTNFTRDGFDTLPIDTTGSVSTSDLQSNSAKTGSAPAQKVETEPRYDAHVRILRLKKDGTTEGYGFSRRVFSNSEVMRIEVSLFGGGFETPDELKLSIQGERVKVEERLKRETSWTYKADIQVSSIQPKRENTLNQTASVFKTTSSKDTVYFKNALKKWNRKRLPKNIALFHDETRRSESYGKKTSEFDSFHVTGKSLFEAGAFERLTLKIETPLGQVLDEESFLISKTPDWIYYSGHYPYDSGGLLGSSSISPFDINSLEWKEHLEVLIFATCYAVDINNYNGKIKGVRGGINGSEWWKKFEGTLLGYYGSAPSRGADAAIAEKFVYRASLLKTAPSDREKYSKELSETWMRANTMDYKSTQASAVDASGNFYFIPRRSVKLRNKHFRSPSGKPWVVVARSDWERKNEEMLKESRVQELVVGYLKDFSKKNNNGRPLEFESVKDDQALKERAREAGMNPDKPEFKDFLRGQLEYEAHIFYDVPKRDIYFEAAIFLAKDKSIDEVLSTSDLKKHFTPKEPRPRAKLLPEQDIHLLTFIEYTVRLMGLPGKGKDRAFVESKLSIHFELNTKEKAVLDKLFES